MTKYRKSLNEPLGLFRICLFAKMIRKSRRPSILSVFLPSSEFLTHSFFVDPSLYYCNVTDGCVLQELDDNAMRCGAINTLKQHNL